MASKPGVRHPKYRDCRTVENQALGNILYAERKAKKRYGRVKRPMKNFLPLKVEGGDL